MLADNIVVEAEASNADEVMKTVTSKNLDLVLLDFSMPGAKGTKLIKDIQFRVPRLPILMLSMHSDPAMIRAALKAGAAGYLPKGTSSPSDLHRAVSIVSSGGNYLPADLALHMALEDHDDAPLLHVGLTRRQLEILKMIARGMKIVEIASALSVSNKTISTHKCRLMKKMKFKTTTELMRYAMENHLLE